MSDILKVISNWKLLIKFHVTRTDNQNSSCNKPHNSSENKQKSQW